MVFLFPKTFREGGTHEEQRQSVYGGIDIEEMVAVEKLADTICAATV